MVIITISNYSQYYCYCLDIRIFIITIIKVEFITNINVIKIIAIFVIIIIIDYNLITKCYFKCYLCFINYPNSFLQGNQSLDFIKEINFTIYIITY